MSGKNNIIDLKTVGSKRNGRGDQGKSERDKVRDLLAEAQKGKDRPRKNQTDSERKPVPIINQSISGDGNTQIGGDLIINSICPTLEEIKSIEDLIQMIAVLETTAKENGMPSPKGMNFTPQNGNAREAVWEKFSEQFSLPGHKGMTMDKYAGALKYLLEWQTLLENQLAQTPH